MSYRNCVVASNILVSMVVLLTACGVESDVILARPAEPSTSDGVRMPASIEANVLAAHQPDGGEAYRFARSPSGRVVGWNEAHRLTAALADGALELTRGGADDWRMALRWTGLGRGLALAPVTTPGSEPHVAENRASYRRAGGSEEQYVNGPLGVEQGFVLAAPPPGERGEALTVEVSVEGDLAPALMDGGAGVAMMDARGATVARYTDLAAFDANGVERRSWFEVGSGVVRLRVDDDGARYPVWIDPMAWTQQAELTASDGAGADLFGWSVALSGDTAVVGAPNHQVGNDANAGAAYVFLHSGAGWTQSAELRASDGATNDTFGDSVSVSGGTAIVGAPGHDGRGAAYVFVQEGTMWIQQAQLTASDAAAGSQFGFSVSVSGSTAIVGAPFQQIGADAEAGAAYVFKRNGALWTQQAELTASDSAANDEFGYSVSVSGGTAIVGAASHEVGGQLDAGATYVFALDGPSWTQQAKLTPSDGAVGDQFGLSVWVSESTAIVGSPFHPVAIGGPANPGAAYVFVRSGTTWNQQAELTPSDGAASDQFGLSVWVSGGAALVGAPLHQVGASAYAGAAYVFTRSGTTWTQQAELTASDGAANNQFGTWVAASRGAVLVGSPGYVVDSTTPYQGATYVFDCTGQGYSTACGDDTGTVFGGCTCEAAPGSSPPRGVAAFGALLGLMSLPLGRRRARSCGASTPPSAARPSLPLPHRPRVAASRSALVRGNL